MSAARPRILYVTDLAYPARGRRYGDEDVFLTSRLREHFDLALCHPLDAAALMDAYDAVVVRNSGPVLGYQKEYDSFRARALAGGTPVYNPLSGKADMAGKQYLLDLSAAGYPVIPTVDRAEDLHRLPQAERYVVKPKLGADSLGLRILPADRLAGLADKTSRASTSPTRCPSTSWTTTSGTPSTPPTPTGAGSFSRIRPPPPTWSSPGASSTGTGSATASSASTPAASGTASCSWSSWRTSTPTCLWTPSPRRPGTPSSRR